MFRLVTLLRLGIERGYDRFVVLAVFLGFRFVAADNHRLSSTFEELNLARLPFVNRLNVI